jgi:hypothetical protein
VIKEKRLCLGSHLKIQETPEGTELKGRMPPAQIIPVRDP